MPEVCLYLSAPAFLVLTLYLPYTIPATLGISRILPIDVPPSAGWEELRAYLDRLEGQQVLGYETCEERVPGSFDEAPPEETSGIETDV